MYPSIENSTTGIAILCMYVRSRVHNMRYIHTNEKNDSFDIRV